MQNRSGLKFENGTRTLLQPVYDQKTVGGLVSVSMSDKNTGALLFLASGAKVIDKNFDIMPGSIVYTAGNTPLFSFAVPRPGKSSNYYIFYSSGNFIRYCEVDLSLRGGLGEVIYTDRLLSLDIEGYVTAVRHSDGESYWLIAHGSNNNEFRTYLIDKNGINLLPVVSATGGITLSSSPFQGSLTTTNNGGLLVHSYGLSWADNCRVEVFEINKCSGKITFKTSITPVNTKNKVSLTAGAAFSKSGKYLYVSYWYIDTVLNVHAILKFDVYRHKVDAPDMDASRINIAANVYTDYFYDQLALAPDGNIYISSPLNGKYAKGHTHISVIYKPDDETGVTFSAHEFESETDSNQGGGYYFPRFIMDTNDNGGAGTANVTVNCFGEPVEFNVTGASAYDSAFWELGDGNTSRQLNFSYSYNNPGTYTVKYKWYFCGKMSEKAETIEIGPPPVINLPPDTTLCAGVKLPVSAGNSSHTYKWSTNETTPDIVVEKPGLYWVEAKRSDCGNRDSVQIDYHPPIWVELGDRFYLCEEDSQAVKLDAGKGFNEYLWTPTGDTTQWIIVKKAGSYYVLVNDFRGCAGEDGTVVERRCNIYAEIPNSFTPNGDGLNDIFTPYLVNALNYTLTIYNRWGQQVFTTNGQPAGWDGTFKNETAPAGVYFYTLYYSGYSNKLLRKYNRTGSLHLVR
ncbi:MAG TPA: gliding motility-associated C-terminal domain-containing protein [Bacteroidia bacterium]|nr:gliding motility-associated C-terminal domain-containing protein [Bacteroidia bacterium]